MRVFQSNGISPRGLLLSHEDFRLFCDTDTPTLLPERMEYVVKKAEGYLEKEITTIPLSAFRSYQEKGVLGPYSTPWCERLDAMFHLGIAEGYERRGRFTEKLCDYVWAILEEASWVLPEHTVHAPYGVTKVPAVVGDKYIHALELGSIYLAACLATVYHYAKDALASVSPIITERVEYELHHRIVMPYINCDFTWEGDRGNKVNNWCPWNISNILLITALTERDMAVRERVVEKALRHLDNFISFYKSDGGCDEGPTYWGAAAGSLFDCLETLEDMSGGRINVYGDPLIKAMGEYIAKFCISGNNFVNFADSGSKCNPIGNHLFRYGKKCGSQILINFSKRMRIGATAGLQFRHPYRSLRTLITPITENESTELAAKSVYFPDLKVMIERESEIATEGLLVAMKGGNNSESHNHNDVGSVIVYHDGEPLLIDAGVGAYTKQTFSPKRYELWFMQSNYHNVAMFDQIGQQAGAAYKSKNEHYDPENRSYFVELSDAYPEAAGVKSYTRVAALCEGYVGIHDEFLLDREREIDLVFLTRREPRIISESEIALERGRTLEFAGVGFSDEKSCDPKSARDFTAEIESFDPVGMNTVRMWGSEKLYRIHIKVVAKTAAITVTIR